MRTSGNNFILLPGVREYSFLFDSVSLSSNEGIAEMGFSGSGQRLAFSLRNGKLYDPKDRYSFDLGTNDSISISGDVSTGRYQFFVNGEKAFQSDKEDFGLQKAFFNSTGCALFCNPKVRSNISLNNLDIELEPSFYAGSSITGRIVNNTDFDIFVYSSRLDYRDVSSTLSGKVSGYVSGMNSLSFSLSDSGSSEFSTSTSFRFIVETSLGSLEKSFSPTRLSNLTGDITLVDDSSFNGGEIRIPFSGSGLANEFSYVRPESGLFISLLQYRRFNRTGDAKDKSVSWQFQPSSPTGEVVNTGNYLTSFGFSESGFYKEMPRVTFLEYGEVNSTTFNPNNLFSLGCGESLPVVFNGLSGEGIGATGTARFRPVQISLYGSHNFYSLTGIEIEGRGTGYNYPAILDLLTGSKANCYDIPRESGNSYIYREFTGTGILRNLAAYAYGVPLTGRRILTISGESHTGFSVTGLRITNMGSGYISGSGFVPTTTFHRAETDPYGDIASVSGFDAAGSFSYNTSGDTYSIENNWIFKTGKSFNLLRPVSSSTFYGGTTGYSGLINLNKGEDSVYFSSSFQQTTLDQHSIIQLSIEADTFVRKSVMITGRSFITDYSGMLLSPRNNVDTGVFIEF